MTETQTTVAAEPSDILDEAQAAALLKIEERTARLWRATRGLPHFKPTSKVVLYSRREIIAWLQRSRVAITRGPARIRGGTVL